VREESTLRKELGLKDLVLVLAGAIYRVGQARHTLE